jgi:putative transcriptional regulator
MAINVHIDRLLVERKMSLTELSEKVGISIQNLSILKTGKARAIRFSTLNMVCQALQCTPGELLSWRKDIDNKQEGDISDEDSTGKNE